MEGDFSTKLKECYASMWPQALTHACFPWSHAVYVYQRILQQHSRSTMCRGMLVLPYMVVQEIS